MDAMKILPVMRRINKRDGEKKQGIKINENGVDCFNGKKFFNIFMANSCCNRE